MRITRWILVALLASSAVLAALPSRTFAQAAGLDTQVLAGDPAVLTAESDPIADRWFGVVGAAICGGEMWLLRTNIVVGMNPYVLAAGIGGCALLALDVFT